VPCSERSTLAVGVRDRAAIDFLASAGSWFAEHMQVDNAVSYRWLIGSSTSGANPSFVLRKTPIAASCAPLSISWDGELPFRVSEVWCV
jgi:hypothetical protein